MGRLPISINVARVLLDESKAFQRGTGAMLSAYRLSAGSAAPTTRQLTLRRTGPGRLNPVST